MFSWMRREPLTESTSHSCSASERLQTQNSSHLKHVKPTRNLKAMTEMSFFLVHCYRVWYVLRKPGQRWCPAQHDLFWFWSHGLDCFWRVVSEVRDLPFYIGCGKTFLLATLYTAYRAINTSTDWSTKYTQVAHHRHTHAIDGFKGY